MLKAVSEKCTSRNSFSKPRFDCGSRSAIDSKSAHPRNGVVQPNPHPRRRIARQYRRAFSNRLLGRNTYFRFFVDNLRNQPLFIGRKMQSENMLPTRTGGRLRRNNRDFLRLLSSEISGAVRDADRAAFLFIIFPNLG
ncbi:MAG: hypothetical protein JNG88_15870 [Phycisphaerales bacterium]|nr:hypothetical protein [Phycisphaerales bacterium]